MCVPAASDSQTAMRQLKRLDERHLWSLVCLDLSQAAQYVLMDNQSHRLLKRLLPGPYTFVLPANSRLPRRVFGKRKDIGIRIPDNVVCRSLLAELGSPLLSTTLRFAGEDEPACDPDEFVSRLSKWNMVVLDAGWGGMIPTTVVDLCQDEPRLLRQGQGAWPA